MITLNAVGILTVAATFVMLYGYYTPPLPRYLLHGIEIGMFFFFVLEKIIRYFNAVSKREYFRMYWFEIPLLAILLLAFIGPGRWFISVDNPLDSILKGVSIYLVVQVIDKVCRGTVFLASSGHNPARSLIGLFVLLILCGGGLLMLPKAHTTESVSFADAVFTATSATCVTGLTVVDTGTTFTLFGELVIMVLIQLGGLGIVIFGAVLALMLGQSLSMRESTAMQDLLSEQTLSRIGKMVGFVFIATILIEAVGAVGLYPMWDNIPCGAVSSHEKWYFSIFHSISAFCNAGFGLFPKNLMDYHGSTGVYLVICPLIVLGGLGFGVLYNLSDVIADRFRRLFIRRNVLSHVLNPVVPHRMHLQTKIVLTMTALLIVGGTLALMLFEHYSPKATRDPRFLSALFQSISARTAGFNTIDMAGISSGSKLILIFLMFIGGSPSSTAGGIKTVTFALLVMVIYTTLRRRRDVELFGRAVPLIVIGRAITITTLYTAVLLIAILAMAITERNNHFAIEDIAFEVASGLGTVGLSIGITPSLTTAGKWIIIITMLIGRLGPLTLLVGMMFNVRPARYDYPVEPLVVG